MVKITVKDLLNNCDCKLLIGNENMVINECFINSKDVKGGGCFFGINGSNVNGSLFYKDAFDNGANVCVLNKIYDLDLKGYDDKTVLIANDPKEVLQEIAKYKRSLFNGIVIAVTGSVGKTSTKEMVANVLKQRYKVLKTIGNQNSQLGLPLTIMRLKNEDVMVLEMGMSNKGEIHNLSLIAKPDIAVITNVLDSHIGNLGSRENILKAKLEIIDGMDCGVLIINNDNDLLYSIKKSENTKLMTFGIINKSNVMPENISDHVKTIFDIDDITNLEVHGGKVFIYNALAAFTVGKLLGLSRSMVKKGINETSSLPHRLEVTHFNNGITLIDDCYNASFSSIKAAIEYLSKFEGRKIAVLGDIFELGKESKEIHKKIGRLTIENKIDILITIGKHSKYIGKEARKLGMKRKYMKHFKNDKISRKYIKKIFKKKDILLLKASNGMNFINLVEYLKNSYQ